MKTVGLLITCILLACARARGDTSYVTTFNSVVQINSIGQATTFASGFSGGGPGGVALDSSSNIYVSDSSGGFGASTILKFTPSGQKTTFASGLSLTYALAFDKNGNLYAAGDGVIEKLDSNGNASVFASGLFPALQGLAFDTSGNLYAADNDKILKFSPEGQQSVFASGLTGAQGLAFDSSGNLYEADRATESIFRFNAAGGKSLFANVANTGGAGVLAGLAFDSIGNLLAVDQGNTGEANGRIDKFDPSGSFSVFASPGMYQSRWIAVQVPEPSAFILLALGGAILLFRSLSNSLQRGVHDEGGRDFGLLCGGLRVV